MNWLVADSLYCPEAFFCSHLDSYSHYLKEYGEDARAGDVSTGDSWRRTTQRIVFFPDVLLALDRYAHLADCPAPKKIAQVAAVCSLMPWDVRKPDGSPAYDCVISSIPWMVDAARAADCRAEYMALAFDTRARVCGMGVHRDLGCIFIGTAGPNHKRRTALLDELKDVVTVLPPVFGRDYFRTLARAKSVFNVHAEWARGAANNMRMFESLGMGCNLITDGSFPERPSLDAWEYDHEPGSVWTARRAIEESTASFSAGVGTSGVLEHHSYELRIPQLVEIARSL